MYPIAIAGARERPFISAISSVIDASASLRGASCAIEDTSMTGYTGVFPYSLASIKSLNLSIFETGQTERSIPVVTPLKGCLWNAQLVHGPPDRQVGLLDQADDLALLGCGVSHSWSPPSAIMLFLSSRFSSICSASASLRSRASARNAFTRCSWPGVRDRR